MGESTTNPLQNPLQNDNETAKKPDWKLKNVSRHINRPIETGILKKFDDFHTVTMHKSSSWNWLFFTIDIEKTRNFVRFGLFPCDLITEKTTSPKTCRQQKWALL